MRKKDKEDDKTAPATADESPERTPPTRSNSMFFFNKKPLVEEPCGTEQFEVVSRPSIRDRAATVDASSSTSFWPARRPSVSGSKDETPERPAHPKSKSTSAVVTTTSQSNISKPTAPQRSQTTDEVGESPFLPSNNRLLIRLLQPSQRSPTRQCGC